MKDLDLKTLRRLESEHQASLVDLQELKESKAFGTFMNFLKMDLVSEDSRQYGMTDPNQIMFAQGKKAGLRTAMLKIDGSIQELKANLRGLAQEIEQRRDSNADTAISL